MEFTKKRGHFQTEPFKNPGHGGRTDIYKMPADILSPHSESHVLAPVDSFRHLQVTLREKIQPAVRAPASGQEKSQEVTRKIKAGDTVKVLRNVTYIGSSFKLYVATAAVNIKDIVVA